MIEPLPALYIKGTPKSAEIDFKPGLLVMSGRSIPEDSIIFFQPVIDWVAKYLENPEMLTMVHFRLEYINSGSNRFIFTMLKMLDAQSKKGKRIVVHWYYEEDDDSIYRLGCDMLALVSLPFSTLPIV